MRKNHVVRKNVTEKQKDSKSRRNIKMAVSWGTQKEKIRKKESKASKKGRTNSDKKFKII